LKRWRSFGRRRVTDATTGETPGDTVFGYADAGDAPAWSRPAGGGAVTTWVAGPTGLLAVTTAAAVTWPLADARGDIMGTADATGAYSPAPAPGRLGPWGTHLRFVADPRTGVVRMGVRLYDPGAGRFLQADPVEGGSCSDYDYVWGPGERVGSHRDPGRREPALCPQCMRRRSSSLQGGQPGRRPASWWKSDLRRGGSQAARPASRSLPVAPTGREGAFWRRRAIEVQEG
jgi:RHS repeat-associated protein